MTAIDFNVRDFDRQVRALRTRLARISAAEVPKAEARALNRAAAWTTTRVRRTLAAAKQIPQRVIQRRISSYKASAKHLSARVWIGVKRKIPIADLPGARTLTSGRKAGTLKAGRLELRPFVATMPNGKRGQFVRVVPGARRTQGRPLTSPPNLPIEEPAIRLMPEAEPILREHAAEAMRTIYVNELRRLLTRALKA